MKIEIIKRFVSVILAASILGWLFPDYIWGEDTVTVTDENGRDVTSEMTPEEIGEGIYHSDSLEITFSWLGGEP